MGRDLSTIVRDLPVEFDLEAARLGDYDRETVIRLFREYEFRSLIERLPAMTGETAGDAAEALRSVASRWLGPGGPGRRRGPSRRLGFGPPGRAAVGRRRTPAVARLRCRRAARRARGSRGRCRGRGHRPAGPPRRRGRPGRPADRAGRGDRRPEPDRGPRGRGDRRPGAVAGRPAGRRRRAAARRSATAARRAGRARARRRGRPDDRGGGPGGRRRAAAPARTAGDPRSSPTRSSRCSWPRIGDDLDAPADAGRVRHPDRGVHPQRVAAQPDRSSDVVAEQLDLILPPVDGARQPGPGRPRGALRDRRPRAAGAAPRTTRASTACTREIELPLIAVLARMEATGVALDLDALGTARHGVRCRDLPARGARSTPTSATSSTSAAPSSSSRSSSTS